MKKSELPWRFTILVWCSLLTGGLLRQQTTTSQMLGLIERQHDHLDAQDRLIKQQDERIELQDERIKQRDKAIDDVVVSIDMLNKLRKMDLEKRKLDADVDRIRKQYNRE